MFKSIKHNNKTRGFTIIEILVALAILVMLGGLSLAALTAIPQAKMREMAQTFKTEFELARSFAKTHGGDATFSIKHTADGYTICRTSNTVTDNSKALNDKKLSIFYKKTGDDKEYKLGFDDSVDVKDQTLIMTFSQTDGSIVGPHMIDYIIMSNGSKSYKFIIQQLSGMIYYDYEVEQYDVGKNVVNDQIVVVDIPRFVVDGNFYDSYGPDNYLTFNYTGQSIQPDISYDAKNIKIGGVYRAVDRTNQDKTYEITFTLKNIHNMQWIDGTKEPKTLVWKIQ